MVGVSESTLKSTMMLLPKQSSVEFKQAAHPLFDGVWNPSLHALMMVILGYDMYMSGMTGVSVTTLAKMIAEEKKEKSIHLLRNHYLLLFIVNSWRRTTYHVKQWTHILMQSYMSQPMQHLHWMMLGLQKQEFNHTSSIHHRCYQNIFNNLLSMISFSVKVSLMGHVHQSAKVLVEDHIRFSHTKGTTHANVVAN